MPVSWSLFGASGTRNAQKSLKLACRVEQKILKKKLLAPFVWVDNSKSQKFASRRFPSLLTISRSIPKPSNRKLRMVLLLLDELKHLDAKHAAGWLLRPEQQTTIPYGLATVC